MIYCVDRRAPRHYVHAIVDATTQPLQNVSVPWDPAVQAIYARPWLQLVAPLADAASSSNSRAAPASSRRAEAVEAAGSGLLSGADDAIIPPDGVKSFTLAAYNILSDVAVNNYIEGYLPIPPFLRYGGTRSHCMLDPIPVI